MLTREMVTRNLTAQIAEPSNSSHNPSHRAHRALKQPVYLRYTTQNARRKPSGMRLCSAEMAHYFASYPKSENCLH